MMKNFTRFLLLIIVCLIFSIQMNQITAFNFNPEKNGRFSGGRADSRQETAGKAIQDLEQPEVEAIIAALKAGNSGLLARYFDTRIDISLPGKTDNYSKKQAEMIIRNFFDLNAVRTFELKHTGENKDGSQFCTGTLRTRTGDFRTILFLKPKGRQLVLQQLSLQELE